jgi:F-type H+-transporting ATPase subunit epsilon
MSENFNLEIIRPDKTLIETKTTEVVLPAFEGQMTILKDHISLITFLRPGIIEIKIENEKKIFYIEEGTVEFFNNNLLILSSTVRDIFELNNEEINKLINEEQLLISNKEIGDKEKYISSYKLETLKEISK